MKDQLRGLTHFTASIACTQVIPESVFAVRYHTALATKVSHGFSGF